MDDCPVCDIATGYACVDQTPPYIKLRVPHAERQNLPVWVCGFMVYAKTKEAAEEILDEQDWGLWPNAGPCGEFVLRSKQDEAQVQRMVDAEMHRQVAQSNPDEERRSD